MEQSLMPLETLQEQGMEYFPQLHLLLYAVELLPGQGIYSLPGDPTGAKKWNISPGFIFSRQ